MSIMPPEPDSKTAPPPTPAGVAELILQSDPTPFEAEVAMLVQYIADRHLNRCDECEMIDGPCVELTYVNTIAIAWLMGQVRRG